MRIERCDICGKLLTIPVSARSAPWEVITCLSEVCEKAADKRAIEYRKNWRQAIPPWEEGP